MTPGTWRTVDRAGVEVAIRTELSAETLNSQQPLHCAPSSTLTAPQPGELMLGHKEFCETLAVYPH